MSLLDITTTKQTMPIENKQFTSQTKYNTYEKIKSFTS